MIRRPMWKISPGHSDDKESRSYDEMTRDERAASWIVDNYISIGFGDVTAGQSGRRAGQLTSFRDTMKSGDLVVFRTQSKIHIGLVGAYYSVDAGSEHGHRRHVTWLESLARDKTDWRMERATKLRPTISPISDKAQKDGVNLYDIVDKRFALKNRILGRIAEPVKADYFPIADGPRPGAFEATTVATNLHNETQNKLLGWLQQRFDAEAVQTYDPTLDWTAQVDLLLEESERITIIEVKSLQDGNDLDQLRYGLAQTLDYMHSYRPDGRDVHGVLWFSAEPKDSARWQELCNRYDVCIGWPGEEERTFSR